MKKILSLLCTLALCTALAAGCSTPGQSKESAETSVSNQTSTSAQSEPSDETQAASDEAGHTTQAPETESGTVLRVVAMKGPTAMGLVPFMNQADTGSLTDNTYSFSIAANMDEISPRLAKGEVDIAAVPANVASVLYNKSKEFQVLAINTLGVLYVVESGDTIKSVEYLKGKTIYATGKGSTPEYVLNYILTGNGIQPSGDVTVEWKSEPAECLSALTAQENAIAMLPQPFVTTAQAKNSQIHVALNLTKEWDSLQQDSSSPSALITGVVIGRRTFIQDHPEAVSAFLDHYKASVDYLHSNAEESARLIGQYDIVPEQIALKALPACNITFIEGSEMKQKLSGYLSVLMEQNPQAIGGSLPDDDFYFSR